MRVDLTTVRRGLTAGAIAAILIGAGATPAAADPGPRRSPPITPPGLATNNGGQERPAQAATPDTGPQNRVNP